MRICCLAVALACSSGQPPPKSAPLPPSKCAHVADHLLSLLTDTAKAAPTEELDRVRAQFKARCEQDRWSVEAQDCFLGLASRDEVNRCASRLSEAQMQALEQPPAESPAGSAPAESAPAESAPAQPASQPAPSPSSQ